jgi:hypothetical protein
MCLVYGGGESGWVPRWAALSAAVRVRLEGRVITSSSRVCRAGTLPGGFDQTGVGKGRQDASASIRWLCFDRGSILEDRSTGITVGLVAAMSGASSPGSGGDLHREAWLVGGSSGTGWRSPGGALAPRKYAKLSCVGVRIWLIDLC